MPAGEAATGCRFCALILIATSSVRGARRLKGKMNEHGSRASSSHIPNAQRIEQERRTFQRALDEYLGEIERASSPGVGLPEKKRTLLAAYAEFRYQVQGGTHCTVCRAPVRHTMTVEVRRPNGSTSHFAALCTRCLEGERARADSVTLRVGPVEYATLRREEEKLPARKNAAA